MVVEVDGESLTIEDVIRVARQNEQAELAICKEEDTQESQCCGIRDKCR